MKFRKITIQLLLLPVVIIAFLACNKEKFPDEFVIYGRWQEISTDSVKTEIEFKRRDVLFLTLVHDTIREYRYLMEKQNELQIFEISEFPQGKRNIHEITYYKKEDQITIFGLYPSTSGESVTVFKRR